jgi:hypothetical protein
MKTTSVLLCGLLVSLALVLSACQENKGMDNPEMFAPNATKLYFGDCDPFTLDQESTDLVYDPADACSGNIDFPARYQDSTAQWYSNAFRVQPGTYYEGCHLVFARNMADAGEISVFDVTFDGLAVHFTQRVEMPVGQTRFTADLFRQGTVSLPTDSFVKVSIGIKNSSGRGALDPSVGTGSYVMTGADQGSICRFEIYLGLAQGLGHPNQGVNFEYLYANGEITDTLAWDFTGGAQILDGPVLLFGPRFGVAYLTAESGGCSDSASFWSLPAAMYEQQTLVTLPAIQWWSGFVSDGDSVWLWQIVANPGDTLTPYRVRVAHLDSSLFFSHPLHTPVPFIDGLFYDETNDLIWVVQSSYVNQDSAWGYTTSGVLREVVSFPDIPTEGLYCGQWLHTTEINRYFRAVERYPLTGGAATSTNIYPIELTRRFSGGAGVGYPGFAAEDLWTVNMFDSLGNWIARQRVNVENAGETVYDVQVFSSDRRVVYALYTYTASYEFYVHVRVLHP